MALAIEKYVLTGPNGECLALKRKNNNKAIIGGNARFSNLMMELLSEIFGLKSCPRPRCTTPNKVRFHFRADAKCWKKSLLELEKAGFTYSRAENMGRIMR